MTAQGAMLVVSLYAAMGALFLTLMLRRFHRGNPVARRIAWLPVCVGLQALNVTLSFAWDSSMASVPVGILSRSAGGWLFIGLALWYLGLYFAGKVNGRHS